MASNRLWGNRDNKIVILDTNAIFMLFEFSIDLEDEIVNLIGKSSIIVPKPIIDEIKLIINKGKNYKKKIAQNSLKIIENKYKIVDLNINKKGDDALIDYAKELSGIVVTNDKDLKKRLRIEKISVIFLRGKNRLNIEGNYY
jgi:rRNA-processing protein FCF1